MIAIGVDTHKFRHTAVCLDSVGTQLGEIEVANSAKGFKELVRWSSLLGLRPEFAVEGTGSYGAGLTEFLTQEGLKVYEAQQPKRKDRRKGKSDAIDALLAAKALISGTGISDPRSKEFSREALRIHLFLRDACVSERTRLMNQLAALLTTAPNSLRSRLAQQNSTRSLVRLVRNIRSRKDATELEKLTLKAMREIVKRIAVLDRQTRSYERELEGLVGSISTRLLAEPGVGPVSAAKLLTLDPKRFTSEAKFARANGTAPIPASSGQTSRYRLNRGGDRQANYALHMIALSRSRHHLESKLYIEKKITEGHSKKEAIRALKRQVSRRLYKQHLVAA